MSLSLSLSPSWLLRVAVGADAADAADIGDDSGLEVDDGLAVDVRLIRVPLINVVDNVDLDVGDAVDDVVTDRFAIRVRVLRNLSKSKEQDMILQLKGTLTFAVKHKSLICEVYFFMTINTSNKIFFFFVSYPLRVCALSTPCLNGTHTGLF